MTIEEKLLPDEGKEREETLRALMEMAWSVGFERVPIPPEKADEARALLREHDARIWEQAAKVCEAVDCLPAVNESTKWPAPPQMDERWVKAVCAAAGRVRAACAAALRARAPKGEKP